MQLEAKTYRKLKAQALGKALATQTDARGALIAARNHLLELLAVYAAAGTKDVRQLRRTAERALLIRSA